MVEPHPRRRELATAFGASTVVAPKQVAALSDAATVGFECSSQNSAFRLLQTGLTHGGRICVLADGNLEPLVLAPQFHERELTVVASSDGLDYRAYATWYWERVRAGIAPLERLFEREIGVSQLAEAFADLAGSSDRPVKVLVRYPSSCPL
jgi:alcohol dehydrogenase